MLVAGLAALLLAQGGSAQSQRAGGPAAPASRIEELRQSYRRPAEIPYPAANPFTPEKALLGRILFFDPRLSGSNLLSCASCHNPSFGWGDGQALAHGHGMLQLGRRTPSVLNAAWGASFFWDGRADTLEQQALGPIAAAGEMNQPLDRLPAKLAAIPGYRPLFEAAFPGRGIALDGIAAAIATFERAVVSGRSPFDRWVEGDDAAIPDAAKRGLMVFNDRAHCARCHKGWNFTDDSFHDIGLPGEDRGREGFLEGFEALRHAFKTPGLRDIARRAPYMHDGSLPTLEAVTEHYEHRRLQRPSLSNEMKPFSLTADERADLVAFLQTLTSPPQDFAAPALPR
ncbi:cytochrome-c peroxidase [Paracraurococcus lichenis]|uniref:Cytochrome c peroxidase n=1 Tax=Paracraurococcus lichenis TaxID=3064888 RepID=A0ABT9E3Y6_9PROT|nr:cytochrome c peroxidase [Paracraurococcus sp. LOR1-02]MDO9710884.1 cytochrome c peroxidase [Paracraurococcus sp. LOR1-02]